MNEIEKERYIKWLSGITISELDKENRKTEKMHGEFGEFQHKAGIAELNKRTKEGRK